MKLLQRSEEIVLMAVWKLQDNAYGVTIREEIFSMTGQEWSIGAVYAPLHRIEKKGLVKTKNSAPVAERGGRSKVFYSVTKRGKEALKEIQKINQSVWNEVPSLS